MTPHYQVITTQHPLYSEVKRLVERILRAPLGQSLDQDDINVHQTGLIHIISGDNNTLLSCCCTVKGNEPNSSQLRHMLTHPNHLKKNYGSLLLDHVEHTCQRQGDQLLYAYARADIIDFYLKNHYKKKGDIFIESSTQLPHQYIEKQLDQSHKNS
jgi:GNAT superfamily N-acetyltransferase